MLLQGWGCGSTGPWDRNCPPQWLQCLVSHQSYMGSRIPFEMQTRAYPQEGRQLCPQAGKLYADPILVASSDSQGWGRQDVPQREGLLGVNLLCGLGCCPETRTG